MKRSYIMGIIIILGLSWCKFASAGQSHNGQYDSELANLRSPNLLKRSDAYYSLKGDQEALHQPIVQRALFELQDRENNTVFQGEGEGYSQYLSDLLDTLIKFVDWKDEREVCTLAESDFGVPSAFAKELATKAGARAVPCLLKRTEKGGHGRTAAIGELLQISQITPDLSETTRKQIIALAIAAFRDQDPGARMELAMDSQRFGTPELVPILEDLARSDPYTLPGTTLYSVREAATKAIQSIQDRAKATTHWP